MITNLPLSDALRKKRFDLEQRIRAYLTAQEITNAQLTETLNLLPTGVKVLLADEWSLDMAFQIADAIGMNVRIETDGPKQSRIFP